MADNTTLQTTPATAPSGLVVAGDDISSVFYQRTKQTLGADGTNTGDWAGRAVEAGVAGYMDPRPYDQQQTQNSAGLTTASTSYSAGDTLGTGWTFTSATRASDGLGIITGAAMRDLADIVTSITLYVFSASITFGTDNSAPSISDSDSQYLCGRIPLGFEDLGGVRVASVDSIALPYWCNGGTSLYVYAVTNVAHTFFGATTDLPIRLFFRPS